MCGRYVRGETHLALLLELHPASIAEPLQRGEAWLDLVSKGDGPAAKVYPPGTGFQTLSHQTPSFCLFPPPYLLNIFIK